jgi:hypothetical protein
MDDENGSEASSTTRVQSHAAAGRWVVVFIFAVAVLLSAFAWWWNYNRGRQALELFGAEGATLVRTAPQVEIHDIQTGRAIDISKAPGLINARASLLSDASYDWAASDVPFDSPPYAVKFRRGEQAVSVTFDFADQAMKVSSTGRVVRLVKKTADGWRSYLARQTAAK